MHDLKESPGLICSYRPGFFVSMEELLMASYSSWSDQEPDFGEPVPRSATSIISCQGGRTHCSQTPPFIPFTHPHPHTWPSTFPLPIDCDLNFDWLYGWILWTYYFDLSLCWELWIVWCCDKLFNWCLVFGWVGFWLFPICFKFELFTEIYFWMAIVDLLFMFWFVYLFSYFFSFLKIHGTYYIQT